VFPRKEKSHLTTEMALVGYSEGDP
jgi:hypothetical protein